MSLQTLPLLIKSELLSFSCCNQISRCLENNTEWDGSKVTCSKSFLRQMKFNYTHCFYYSKCTGRPSTQQEIPCNFIQYSFYAKSPLEKERIPSPVFQPGEFHGLHSPWGCKESDVTEPLSNYLSSDYSGLVRFSTRSYCVVPCFVHIAHPLPL